MKFKPDSRLVPLINKQVPFQFFGEKLKFNLSMGLFSSFDIDSGTRLLLKTLAQKVDFDRVKTVVDTGCGTGVIGISLKKRFPTIDILFQDRDNLAMAFTKSNSKLNGIELKESAFENGLLLENLSKGSQDLIVSNIPAKAGEKVIKEFFYYGGSYLKEGGVVAVVIVEPLRELAEQALEEGGCQILHQEHTKMHSVYHFSGGKPYNAPQFSSYIRHKGKFKLIDDFYKMETVYNLPDFNQPSYSTLVSAELLHHRGLGGDVLFWNPGQGHIPTWLSKRGSNHFKSVTLASRDILQNRISKRNLENSGFEGEINSLELPGEVWLKDHIQEGSLDFLMLNLSPITKVKWHEDIANLAKDLVKMDKYCFIQARSSDMSQLVRYLNHFEVIEDDRFKGNRGLLLKRR